MDLNSRNHSTNQTNGPPSIDPSVDAAVERPILLTDRAQCRDCYRCVRVCPVKAIQMRDDQAQVVPERCILCGKCIEECPQKARYFRNDLSRAKRLIEQSQADPNRKTAISVAPSFAALFLKWQRDRLPSALRKLGFDYVGETAIGAGYVAEKVSEIVRSDQNSDGRAPHIGTACPAVVRYVERYQPDQIERLLPIVSPMIAHARHIRKQLDGEISVIFVGPCLAKKAEAERPELTGEVQCVLTFTELLDWLAEEEIELASCEESDFDEEPVAVARVFPLEGGCLRTAGWRTDLLDRDVVATSGLDEVCSMLKQPPVQDGPRVIEPLLCRQGCIGGPAMPDELPLFARRSNVLRHASQQIGKDRETRVLDLETTFHQTDSNLNREYTENEIRRVLETIGKAHEEDQLDCGACGYSTCREKAIFVLRGLAEPSMCIPRMRHLAQQRTDRIIETSPNGIVILDSHLTILHMNRAFRNYFACSEAMCGRPISVLMDPAPFEKLLPGGNDVPPAEQDDPIELTVEHKRHRIITHQIHYRLPEENQLVGIFVNITGSCNNQAKLDHVRAETVLQARELLQHQLDMAETIARALGESTARGEALVEKLLQLAEDAQPHPNETSP